MPKVKKLGKPPKWLYPFSVERKYRRGLLDLVKLWEADINRLLIPRIEAWINERAGQRGDTWADEAAAVMTQLHLSIGNKTEVFIANDLPPLPEGTNRWNQREWTKTVNKVLGVSLIQQEPWLKDQIDSWTRENVELIRGMKNQTLKEVDAVVNQGIKQGKRNTTIKKALISKVKIKPLKTYPFESSASVMRKTRNRAKLISDDQIGKLNSQLTESRQTQFGIKRYRWRNAGDIRVRGRPDGLYPNAFYNHWDREGKIYTWEKGAPDGHPGFPIRCRCWAEGVFEDVVEGISLAA